MNKHANRLKSQRAVSGRSNRNAPWATVMQRAKTPKGPIKESAISGNQNVAGLPSLPKNSLELPSKRSIAKMPRKGTSTPVSRMPKAAKVTCPSLICPTTRGKTRFPDPKNMENMARPVERIKDLFFMDKSIGGYSLKGKAVSRNLERE